MDDCPIIASSTSFMNEKELNKQNAENNLKRVVGKSTANNAEARASFLSAIAVTEALKNLNIKGQNQRATDAAKQECAESQLQMVRVLKEGEQSVTDAETALNFAKEMHETSRKALVSVLQKQQQLDQQKQQFQQQKQQFQQQKQQLQQQLEQQRLQFQQQLEQQRLQFQLQLEQQKQAVIDKANNDAIAALIDELRK